MNEASRSPFSRLRFQFFISLAMRALLVRDGIFALFTSPSSKSVNGQVGQPIAILSGTRRLDGLFFIPSSQPKASVLILHGIGERLSYWQRAQEMLATHEIASLIFDYSGYGKSAGATTPENLRQDTLAAYDSLRSLVPDGKPPFLLGLSLGTGVAIDATPYLLPAPSGVVLCEAFSSLRGAAQAVLASMPLPIPAIRQLAKLVPDLYRTATSISEIRTPILLVHSDADELFPVSMAHEIFSAVRDDANHENFLVVPHGYAHNDAYLNPEPGYWKPILDFVLPPDLTSKR